MSNTIPSVTSIKPVLFYHLLLRQQVTYYDYMHLMGLLDAYDYILPDNRFVFPALNFLLLHRSNGDMKKAWAWSWMAECLTISEQFMLIAILDWEKSEGLTPSPENSKITTLENSQ